MIIINTTISEKTWLNTWKKRWNWQNKLVSVEGHEFTPTTPTPVPNDGIDDPLFEEPFLAIISILIVDFAQIS